MSNTRYQEVQTAEQTFLNVLPAIIAALPGKWSYTTPASHYVRITRASDGLELAISCDGWKKRVHATPAVPQDGHTLMSLRDWGVIGYHDKRPEASCALDRAPAAIARDIDRKVLTPYEPLYVKVLEKQRERNAAYHKSEAVFRKLAALCGARVHDRDIESLRSGGSGSFYINEASGTVTVRYGGSVELKTDLPTDRMEKILKLVCEKGEK